MRLTKRMATTLRQMATGWELGQTVGGRDPGSVHIQKNGFGRGGETQAVHFATFWGLYSRGLIVRNVSKFPATTYKLTPDGKKAAAELGPE